MSDSETYCEYDTELYCERCVGITAHHVVTKPALYCYECLVCKHYTEYCVEAKK